MAAYPEHDDDPQRYPVSRDQAATALQWLLAHSQRQCYLQLPLLDNRLINPATVDAIKDWVLHSHRRELRLLLDETGQAVQQGHRLIELARRLPERVQIRQPADDDRDPLRCHVVADQRRLLQLSGWPEPLQAWLCAQAIPQAPRLQAAFEHRWQSASPSLALRALHL